METCDYRSCCLSGSVLTVACRDLTLCVVLAGMWFQILLFVNFCGVVSNAFLIAFTSSWGAKYSTTGKLIIVIAFEVGTQQSHQRPVLVFVSLLTSQTFTQGCGRFCACNSFPMYTWIMRAALPHHSWADSALGKILHVQQFSCVDMNHACNAPLPSFVSRFGFGKDFVCATGFLCIRESCVQCPPSLFCKLIKSGGETGGW